MKSKYVTITIFFLSSLLFSNVLLAQQTEYISELDQKNAFQKALNRQKKTNAQNKKYTRLQLTLISNYSAVDNSLYAMFLNVDQLFSNPFEKTNRQSYLTTYYRQQGIYFRQNFNTISGNQINPNIPIANLKDTPYDKWLDVNTEKVIHYDDFVDMPPLLPPFKNIIHPPTGFFMIHKF